jgi:hypothetical protein
MDYNAIGIKLNLYWNNYSIQTMQAKQMKSNETTIHLVCILIFKPQLKGIQDATLH